MNELMNVLQPYLLEIIVAVLTGIATFIGTKVKKIYEEKVNTETKEKVVKTVVNAVEQIYKDLKGEEKLNICIENATEMLNEKGITITELELRMLIESSVNSFNKASKGE
jgi:hypothetical protein